VIDKGDLGVEHFLPIAFQVFKSFYGIIGQTFSFLRYVGSSICGV
jgi:hypothetical protein